jgi:hypothetical protein
MVDPYKPAERLKLLSHERGGEGVVEVRGEKRVDKGGEGDRTQEESVGIRVIRVKESEQNRLGSIDDNFSLSYPHDGERSGHSARATTTLIYCRRHD